MTPRHILAILALLSQTGCVAALPMVAQMISSPDSTARLCSMTKMPGQTESLCDRMPFAMGQQRPVDQTERKTVAQVQGKTIAHPSHKASDSNDVTTAER